MNKQNPAVVMQRAYARLDVAKDNGVKEDADYFYIDGIASTPTPDRMGDVVSPMGAQFKLPMPLLWQHDSMSPIGNVISAKPTKKGIPIQARMPKVKEAGVLQDRINEAVQSIKYGLVAGLSIGFRALPEGYKFIADGGIEFEDWEWMELSVVTIPANSDASIATIKSFDVRAGHAATKPRAKTVKLLPHAGRVIKPGVFRLPK